MMKQDFQYTLGVASGQVELAKAVAKREQIFLLEAIQVLKLVALRDQEASLEGISSVISGNNDTLVRRIKEVLKELLPTKKS